MCPLPVLRLHSAFQQAPEPGASPVQQHPLIAGTQAEKGTNLVGGQAVNVTQRNHCALLLRELSQTILKLVVIFGCQGLLFR
jgi:hypothetical protein